MQTVVCTTQQQTVIVRHWTWDIDARTRLHISSDMHMGSNHHFTSMKRHCHSGSSKVQVLCKVSSTRSIGRQVRSTPKTNSITILSNNRRKIQLKLDNQIKKSGIQVGRARLTWLLNSRQKQCKVLWQSVCTERYFRLRPEQYGDSWSEIGDLQNVV